MAEKLIVVVGATGNQGGSVARTFAALPGWKVRGLTRDPSKASSQPLRELGVEMVAADLDDKESLVRAFTGASAIFGVTDFWQFYFNPQVKAEAEQRGIRIPEMCVIREIAHGKNTIDAAAQVLKQEGKLERFVLSTLSDSKKWSKGAIQHQYHFDAKAQFTNYLTDAATPELAALNRISSFLQVGFYLDNWRGMGGPIKWIEEKPDGSVTYRSMSEGEPYNKIPFVHPPTDTGPFVEALVLRAPPGSTLLGTSGEMNFPEYTKLLAKQWGKKVNLQPTSYDELIKFCGPELGLELYESAKYTNTYGFDGGDPAVKKPAELGVKLDALTTPEQYVKQTDWSSVVPSVAS